MALRPEMIPELTSHRGKPPGAAWVRELANLKALL
jgi:hypothetical protein